MGFKIKEVRKSLKMSQEELADQLNVSRQAVSKRAVSAVARLSLWRLALSELPLPKHWLHWPQP